VPRTANRIPRQRPPIGGLRNGEPEFNGEGCRAEDPGATFKSKTKRESNLHGRECLWHSTRAGALAVGARRWGGGGAGHVAMWQD
jgi:hypothetical protein